MQLPPAADKPESQSTYSPVTAQRPRKVDFLHPGYPGSTVLLSLPAFDDGGIDFDTALAACGLHTGNRWSDGFFSPDRSGAVSVERPEDGILRDPQYFFNFPARLTLHTPPPRAFDTFLPSTPVPRRLLTWSREKGEWEIGEASPEICRKLWKTARSRSPRKRSAPRFTDAAEELRAEERLSLFDSGYSGNISENDGCYGDELGPAGPPSLGGKSRSFGGGHGSGGSAWRSREGARMQELWPGSTGIGV